MPTYDYKCNACEHTFEQFQSMKDKPLKVCPKCGKKTLERLIGTGAAIVFKGSGFYQTDYRSESYKKAKEAEGKPVESKSDAKSESKSAESKPASSASEPAKKSEPAKVASDSKKKAKGKAE